MKKLTSVIILMVVLFAVSSLQSQPLWKIHVFGGYNVPMAGLGGNSNFPPTDGTPNGATPYAWAKSGFNAGADGKYFLGKKRNIGLLISGAYDSYSTGDLQSSGVGVGTLKYNAVRIAIGGEYDFIPVSKSKTFVNPFVGIDLVGNFLSGKFTPDGGGTALTMNSASRFGFALGAGIDIMVNKAWGFVVGAKYDYINLIGKQDNSTQTPSANTFYLQDKAYTYTNPLTSTSTSVSAMNLMDIQFYGGVTFAFGK